MANAARRHILEAVRQNLPQKVPLPNIPHFTRTTEEHLRARFIEKVRKAGGEVWETSHVSLDAMLAPHLPGQWASTIPGLEGSVQLHAVEDPHTLADLEALVCWARLGVAENGAVWLDEEALGQRAAAFLVDHLIVVLEASRIVADLHEAYAVLASRWQGFGLWVAGPSKTADIEQTLVHGVHGPRRFTVVLANA